MPDLRQHDTAKLQNYLRMDMDSFEFVFSLVEKSISKQDTNFRKAIPAREKLAATLRILATSLVLHQWRSV